MAKVRGAAQEQRDLVRAATNMQKYWRGWKGRQEAKLAIEFYKKRRLQHEAALKIQLLFHQHKATRRVEEMRGKRLGEMDGAASYIRKVFIGQKNTQAIPELEERVPASNTVYHYDTTLHARLYVPLENVEGGCACRGGGLGSRLHPVQLARLLCARALGECL
jgi:hypothetical protein